MKSSLRRANLLDMEAVLDEKKENIEDKGRGQKQKKSLLSPKQKKLVQGDCNAGDCRAFKSRIL